MYAAAVPAPAPPHSTTNDYVPGADEPDLVKTDGSRVITVERGVLRIVNAATRTVTARLDAGRPAAGVGCVESARRRQPGARDPRRRRRRRCAGPRGRSRPYPDPINEGSRYVLVDLSGSPKVLGTLTPSGDYVDARLVGSTVRLVVRSQPNLAIPQPGGAGDDTQRLAQASAAGATGTDQCLATAIPTAQCGRGGLVANRGLRQREPSGRLHRHVPAHHLQHRPRRGPAQRFAGQRGR